MDIWISIFSVAFITLIAIISPSPNFFVVISTSLTYKRKIEIFTATGIALGSFLYASAGLLCLAIIIQKSYFIFTIIKILGGIYLYILD